MKSRNAKKNAKSRLPGRVMFLFLVMLLGVIIIFLPSVTTKKFSYGATIPFTPVPAKPNLQLEWFLIPTYSPPQQHVTVPAQTTVVPSAFSNPSNTPSTGPNPATCSGYVNSGVPVPSSCTCPGVYLICPYTKSDPTDVTVGPNGCETPLAGSPPTTGKFCIDKPVIYLYPQKPTIVDVSIKSTGYVAVSYPLYLQGGWENIIANPGGTMQYQGNQYSELFYETSVTQFQKPTSGIILPTDTLTSSLNIILDQLGLMGNEKKEFLSYWVPRLQALHSPYIFFSLLSPSAKNAIDAVEITPKPDTMIDFIAYFKPVKTYSTSSILHLPKPPQRKGFTAVEWGGVVDN